MKLTSGELLSVNATLIIGLLVLLTFSSVSSPFGQTEQSTFFTSWYDKKQELHTLDQKLYDCNLVIAELDNNDKSFLRSSFTNNSLWDIDERPTTKMDTRLGDPIKGGEEQIILNRDTFNLWFDEYSPAFLENCDKLPYERYTLGKNLEVLTDWGVEFHYLRINSEGNPVESKYHLDLASGPFLANMVNLGMIFPFLFSAIAEVIVKSRKTSGEQASKIGTILMTIGFISMVVGLSIIAYSFYEASRPYI